MEVDEQCTTVPQSEPVAQEQVLNSAGGYTWKVSDMNRLRRFLVLGAEGGTYYIGEKQLGRENAQCISRLISSGRGEEVVQELVKFSTEGRAAKQNPIVFALAMCARQDNDIKVKRAAYNALSQVCRIPTHLFTFVNYSEALSVGTGWGRAQRKAISSWYNKFEQDPQRLARHVTKYRNRNGWTHTDVLRLAHPKPVNDGVGAVVRYVIKGFDVAKKDFGKDSTAEGTDAVHQTLEFLQGVEDAKNAKSDVEVVQLVKQHQLAWEHIPTGFLKSKLVWQALLEHMPMTAMIRNLAKMTSIGLLEEGNKEAQAVQKKLINDELLKKAKIHPFNVLLALKTYEQGKGEKGKLKWKPVAGIVKALNDSFYKSFVYVKPTNKRYLLAVDVSGSMSWGNVNGSDSITPQIAAAAMAMVTARTETKFEVVGFSTDLVPLPIKPSHSLEETIRVMQGVPMGGTDCAQPMIWAKQKKKEFDVFIVYTDCETWAGDIHPDKALREYRESSGIFNAKLIVCAMTSNGFTIADPDDPGMLDMCGFDSAGPEIMRNFVLEML